MIHQLLWGDIGTIRVQTVSACGRIGTSNHSLLLVIASVSFLRNNNSARSSRYGDTLEVANVRLDLEVHLYLILLLLIVV